MCTVVSGELQSQFAEHSDADCWFPLHVVSVCSEWDFGVRKNSVNRNGGVVDRCHDFGEARPSGVMTIFVPPTVFGEVKTVFDAPVISYVAENIVSRNVVRVEAGDEVARVAQYDVAIISGQLTIDTNNDLAAGQVKRFADVLGVL